MLPLEQLITIDRNSDTAAYLQITNAFIQHIHDGRFRKGLKLPGSREVADLLKINRMTAVAAYDELEAQGWIEMVPRKGAFVKVNHPTLSPKKLSDRHASFKVPDKPGFLYDEKKLLQVYTPDFPPVGKIVVHDGGFTDVRLSPIEELVRKIRSHARITSNKKYLMYGNAQGTLFLREALAEFLCDTRGLSITSKNILITKGAQMGLYLTAAMLLKKNDEVVVGTPGYSGANLTFLQTGAKINYVSVDDEGIDVDALEKLCSRKKIKMIYVIPHHHHPTSATLSPERRVRLLTLASKHKFAILEDDYDYDFHYGGKPMMPMASVDRNGNVLYIGTLTKSLAPAIRLGFIVGPESFIQAATGLRKSIDTQGDSLIENAVAELYRDGTISRHLKKSIRIYGERRDHFCALLRNELSDMVSFNEPEGGMSVWAKFLKHDLPSVSEKAAKKGLIIRDGTDYDIRKMKYNAVGLGFASLNFSEQDKAIGILKSVLEAMG